MLKKHKNKYVRRLTSKQVVSLFLPDVVVNGMRCTTTDLGGLLGAAIQPQQQCGDDAVHSTSSPTLEQNAERLSSSLLHSKQPSSTMLCNTHASRAEALDSFQADTSKPQQVHRFIGCQKFSRVAAVLLIWCSQVYRQQCSGRHATVCGRWPALQGMNMQKGFLLCLRNTDYIATVTDLPRGCVVVTYCIC